MLWYVLSIIGAVADAAYYISAKKFLEAINPHILAAGCYLSTGILLILISLAHGVPPIGHDFTGAIIVSSVLGILAILLTYSALRHTDISLAVPMISFTPLFLIVTAYVFLHEVPSLLGMAGIVVIVTGSYVLNLSPSHRNLTDPFRSMVRNRGVLYMLIVSVIYALAINFDKIIVTNSDPVFGSAIACLVLGLAFTVISFGTSIRRRRITTDSPDTHHKPDLVQETIPVWHFAGPCILMGILLSIAAVSINIAYTMQIVPYVIAIKRMSIILIVLYGTFIFGEKEMVRRLFGAALMVAGAVVIVLFN